MFAASATLRATHFDRTQAICCRQNLAVRDSRYHFRE
jgi:hypothetical protein